MIKKNLLLFSFGLMTLVVFGQKNNVYGIKSVTVSNSTDCITDISNSDSLIFCDLLCALRECKDEFRWLTVYNLNSDRIYQGIALHAIGPHLYWIKEVTVYDSKWSIIEQHYDSLINMKTLLKLGVYRSKELLTKANRLNIISLMDGSIIQHNYPKPKNQRDKLENQLDCN